MAKDKESKSKPAREYMADGITNETPEEDSETDEQAKYNTMRACVKKIKKSTEALEDILEEAGSTDPMDVQRSNDTIFEFGYIPHA